MLCKIARLGLIYFEISQRCFGIHELSHQKMYHSHFFHPTNLTTPKLIHAYLNIQMQFFSKINNRYIF